jgi:hypothetical protein
VFQQFRVVFHFLHHCLNLSFIRNVHHSDHGEIDIDFDVTVTVVLVVVVDFDGDKIKTIAEPLMNSCVTRNYRGLHFDYTSAQIPVLHIPSATPQILDANDWKARFETVRSTFDERIR